MTALRVGLTGGLAAGKSTVGHRLREAGLRVVDSDAVVAALYAPGQPGARAVQELLGDEALDESGAVYRPRVADRVFSDPEARRRLEESIHPLVRAHFAAAIESEPELVVLEAPLLVEGGFDSDCDVIVTVEAEASKRAGWAVGRGLDRREAEARIAAQTGADTRIAAADIVLRNDGSLEDLEDSADRLAERLRQLAAEHAASGSDSD